MELADYEAVYEHKNLWFFHYLVSGIGCQVSGIRLRIADFGFREKTNKKDIGKVNLRNCGIQELREANSELGMRNIKTLNRYLAMRNLQLATLDPER